MPFAAVLRRRMAAVGALGTGASFMWIVAHACAPGPKRLDHTFAASPPAIPTGEDQVAVEPAWSHIAGMESRPSVSPNLFNYASAQPARGEQPQALPPRLPRPEQLAELSDTDLASLTALLANELHRRVRDAPGGRVHAELKQAIEYLAAVQLPSASPTRAPAANETSSILNGKRKAIRAALVAGVKPRQVAKHFGLSLADVRKVASQAG